MYRTQGKRSQAENFGKDSERHKEFYHSKIGELQKKEAYVRQQLNIANGIIKELSPDINEESRDKVESLEKEKIRTKGSKDSR